MNATRVREARTADLPAIGALLGQLTEAAHGAVVPDQSRMQGLLQAMQASPGTHHNLVADEQGRLVGFLSLVPYRTLLHGGGTAPVSELAAASASTRPAASNGATCCWAGGSKRL